MLNNAVARMNEIGASNTEEGYINSIENNEGSLMKLSEKAMARIATQAEDYEANKEIIEHGRELLVENNNSISKIIEFINANSEENWYKNNNIEIDAGRMLAFCRHLKENQ